MALRLTRLCSRALGRALARGAVCARWSRAALLAWTAASSVACQLVLDDIEVTSDAALEVEAREAGSHDGPDAEAARAEDASAEEDAPSHGSDAGPARDGAGDDPADVGTSPSSADAGGGAEAAVDAASAPAADAATGVQDGGTPVPDADLSCAQPDWWYEDEDRDGHGRASSRVRACAAPASGHWALSAGDCNDDDPRVHPGQSDYFDLPYRAPDGSDSFDYDCSGAEEGNAQQTTLAADGCGLLSVALCSGSGYLPVRAGAPNPWCGSHQRATCQGALLGALVCQPNINNVVDAYVCR